MSVAKSFLLLLSPMPKRSIAIFLLFFASTIWLAHAIVPHHHHKTQACLQAKHCFHESRHHSNFPETDSHHHDSNTSSNCSLNQSAIVPQPILKSNRGLQETPQFNSDNDFIQVIIIHTYFSALLSSKTHTVFLNRVSKTLYLLSIGHSFGLRAPPAV